ncbi:MAG: hypothetical protein SOZ34_09825 [Clostridia bacterium]|nr:hypothetical protein [Clostridia bacterium]
MLKLEIKDKNNNVLFSQSGKKINAEYDKVYCEGDKIIITISDCEFIKVKLEESLAESIIYVPEGVFEYLIPFGEKRVAYKEDAWTKEHNTIAVSEAENEEIYSYRNIALNSTSKRYEKRYFPYAEANHVTRDEAWFEERNSIDGCINQDGHGAYPFQSYAGGAREDIEYYLHFGKKAEIDKIIFYLRADFKDDHDTYWKSLDIELSDGTKIPVTFEKSNKGQTFEFDRKYVTDSIHLTNFKQAAFPLSWAALTQIEVYGKLLK